MDTKFLEFWGNYLLAVSRGQQRMEDLSLWMQQGFAGFQQLNDMFRAFYGLPASESKSSKFDKAWHSATAAFNESYKEYLKQLGWVSRQDFEDLARENEALKREVETLEKTVKRIQNQIDSDKTVSALQELADKQSREFNNLMQTFSEAMEKAASKNKKNKPGN